MGGAIRRADVAKLDVGATKRWVVVSEIKAALLILRDRLPGILQAVVFFFIVFVVIFSYVKIWGAHIQAEINKENISGSEQRLIFATMIAALVSLTAAILNWFDRSRSLRLESQKKAIELRTDAAFEMWKAATSAYRLLQKSETNEFGTKDLEELTQGFLESERTTLLLNDETLKSFQLFWNESERLGELLIVEGKPIPNQSGVWDEELDAYASSYEAVKVGLRSTIRQLST